MIYLMSFFYLWEKLYISHKLLMMWCSRSMSRNINVIIFFKSITTVTFLDQQLIILVKITGITYNFSIYSFVFIRLVRCTDPGRYCVGVYQDIKSN